ncbi:hypothetical protein [Portibacter marinus]|uniref:hypothetical protein n=1 Tax=Portibacter marinus TaxID=2898660 RepID=UPI001F1F301E|nr:hypothetical protein [Portibacter marinus]
MTLLQKIAIGITIIAVMLAPSSILFAQQNNMGIATTNHDPSAILEITSEEKGFLPPRITKAQRDQIHDPAIGLMIFCTDCGVYGEWQSYRGGGWNSLSLSFRAEYEIIEEVTDVAN